MQDLSGCLDWFNLLPLNRFKLVVDKNFTWRTNGPIQNFFQQYDQPEFLNAKFQEEDEALIFANGYLSKNSRICLLRQLKKVTGEFYRRHEEDAALPLSQRQGTSLMMALRPWDFSVFRVLASRGELTLALLLTIYLQSLLYAACWYTFYPDF